MKFGKLVVMLVAVALVFSVVPVMAAKNLQLFEKGVEMMLISPGNDEKRYRHRRTGHGSVRADLHRQRLLTGCEPGQ